MDSIKMAEFLFIRIEETISLKEHIKEVQISYEYDETYGNCYVRFIYKIDVFDSFYSLSFQEKFNRFNGSPNYTFSLSTHAGNGRDDEKKQLVKFIEFKQIYESLTAYAIFQLEKYLNQDTPIKVKGIDFWPYTNYAQKYLDLALNDSYLKTMNSLHSDDVRDWEQLHMLARKSRPIYIKDKRQFALTDIEINEVFRIGLGKIRTLLIRYHVPIIVKGIKIVDEIRIHIPSFISALRQELSNDYVIKYFEVEYETLLSYLYTRYFPTEKEKIIQYQQSAFVESFMIRKGDVLELKDKRIVVTDSVILDTHRNICITYLIMKTNLESSERSRTVTIYNVAYVLKEQEFLNYLAHISFKHLSLLKKWMTNRKKKIDFKPFKLDLIRGLSLDSMTSI